MNDCVPSRLWWEQQLTSTARTTGRSQRRTPGTRISKAVLLTIRNLPIPSRYDGIVTALCQPNLKFSVPYDISSWGSCLAKCPASKPVPPEPLDKHKLLLLDEDYMTEEKVVCRTFLE